MAASLKLLPGSTARWRGRRYLIVDYESLDAIIARQPGKRRLERIPVNEAAPDHASHIVAAWTPDLASVPEEAWQKAVKRFEILKPLLNMGNSERTFAHIKKAACALGKHPATIYRWIESYNCSGRLSELLRKNRADRGNAISRLGDSFRLWGAAPNKHRSGARWERSYCSQRRRSIRYARADRHPGTHQLRKQLGPLADHNRVREHQGAPRQISLSKLFANSIATFAFISARSAHVRRYFWN